MELINWSLKDIFTTRSLGSGEPTCPPGTFAAGYVMDAWEKWRVVCLAALPVEDIEDIYLFGTMIIGFLLIGLGLALVHRQKQKTVAAVQTLPAMIDGLGRAVGTLEGTMNRYMDTIVELNLKMDGIMEKLTALQNINRRAFWTNRGG